MPRKRSRLAAIERWFAKLPRPAGLGRSGVHLVTLGLALLSFWLLTSFVSQVITSAQMDRRRDELQTQIAQAESRNAQLATSVSLSESPGYIERIAREQLGFAREGDVVVLPILPQVSPTPLQPTPVVLPTPVPEPNWRGWTRAFFP
jgi:cell division protein FtsB